MLTAVARDESVQLKVALEGGLMLSLESQRVFQNWRNLFLSPV